MKTNEMIGNRVINVTYVETEIDFDRLAEVLAGKIQDTFEKTPQLFKGVENGD